MGHGTLGDVMYLDALRKPIVILNSLKSSYGVLEHRASNPAGRPRLIVANEIIFGGLAITFMDYGEV
jgi:hypothetical protein